jgi:hypothetical protein
MPACHRWERRLPTGVAVATVIRSQASSLRVASAGFSPRLRAHVSMRRWPQVSLLACGGCLGSREQEGEQAANGDAGLERMVVRGEQVIGDVRVISSVGAAGWTSQRRCAVCGGQRVWDVLASRCGRSGVYVDLGLESPVEGDSADGRGITEDRDDDSSRGVVAIAPHVADGKAADEPEDGVAGGEFGGAKLRRRRHGIHLSGTGADVRVSVRWRR